MFKNIGKWIHAISLIMAALCFIGFAVFGVLCLMAATEQGVDETLKKAGMQAAYICFGLAIVTPFLNLIVYGFGSLIIASQQQAENSKKTRELLQSALSGGMLSDEIARKLGQVQAQMLSQLQTRTQQAPQSAAPRAYRAPIQRPVEEPATAQEAPKAAPAAPVATPIPVQASEPAPVQETAPQQTPVAPTQTPVAPIEPVAPTAQEAPKAAPAAPVAPPPAPVQAPAAPAYYPTATPFGTAPLRPIRRDEQSF